MGRAAIGTVNGETMTKAQEHALRLSDIAGRLNEIGLLEGDAYGEEVRSEETKLQEESREVRTRYNSALVAEGDAADQAGSEFGAGGSSEDRAYRALIDKANVGDIMSATFEKRQTDGASAELQKHHGIGSHQIPLEMLRIDRGVEERAAATVPASIGDASQAEVITPVFASGDGAFMGIERPTVPVGDAAYPVLSTMPAVKGPFTDSTEAAQTDAEFVATNLSPERLQASFSYRRTDAARFAGLDASLRLALNGGLQEKLDQQAINGSDGLLNGTNLPNNNVSNVSTFALYLSGLLYGRVDGRYARTPGDVRMIVGAGTFTHASSAYKGNNSDESANERMSSQSGGLMVSAHVPDVASNRQNALIRLGSERGAAIQPMWEGISLIVDEFTRAAFGEIIVHAVLLSNFSVTRKAQWSKRQTQHA